MELVQMEVGKVILGYSQCTNNAIVGQKLGIHSLKTGRGVRKLKWQCRLHNMKERRPPQEKQIGNQFKRVEGLLSEIL